MDGPLRLCVRADASERTGSGHVMRFVALADAWAARGGRVRFVVNPQGAGVLARFRPEYAATALCVDASPDRGPLARLEPEFEALLRRGPCWAVLDGYHFGPDYQRAAGLTGAMTLVADDRVHHDSYHAHILLNQNVHADTFAYPPFSGVRLLGPRFAQIRREFRPAGHPPRTFPPRAGKVLVTFGGSDPHHGCDRTVAALRRLGLADLRITVLCGVLTPGPLNPETGGGEAGVRRETGVRDMAGHMAWADLAVTAAGVTCLEAAAMGLASLIATVADNQAGIAEAMAARGAGINLGDFRRPDQGDLDASLRRVVFDRDLRMAMSRRGMDLVDAKGPQRLADLMGFLDRTGASLEPRVAPAREEDCREVWMLANDPDVRASAFASEPIAYASHRLWYAARLSDPRCRMYLSRLADALAGLVRYDIGDDGVMDIDIAVAPGFRGRRLGRDLLAATLARAGGELDARAARARVKPWNTPSRRLFEGAGFGPASLPGQDGRGALTFLRTMP